MFYIQIASGSLQTLEEVGITSARLNYAANGVDSFEFQADSALTAAGIAFATEVKVYDVALCVFIGEITDTPSDASADSPARKSYRARSYLNRLDRIQYTQGISAYNAGETEFQTWPDPRVVLGMRYPATPVTNTVQIADVLDFAITYRAVPITRSGTWPAGFQCPIDQKEDISCWDAVVSQLRWLPDHVLWCDYSSGSTVVKLSKASDITAVSLAADGDLSGISATPRHDLVMPGVNVYFRKVMSVDGSAAESRTVQSAGDHIDPLAASLYVDLDGGSAATARQKITAAEYPDFSAVSSAALRLWLETKAPWLADITGYEIAQVTRSGAHSYAKELIEGTILKWMPVQHEEETIVVTIKYDIEDGDGNPVESATTKIPVQVTSCNGASKTYSKVMTSDSGEAEPAGLAAGIYASWSMLHWDGSVSSFLPKTGYILPGARLNITGAHASLASMAALVQSASVDLQTLAIAIDFGTCRALEADSYTALYRALRYRRFSTRLLADEDEEDAVEKDETSILASPRGHASASPAVKRSQIGGAHASAGSFDLDAADLEAGDTARLRDFTYTPAGGSETTVKILATDAVTIPPSSSGIPAGCSQLDVTLYAKEFKITAKLNYKTVGETTTYYGLSDWSISAYTSADKRLLLQGAEPSTGTFTLDLGKGYLKE